MNSADVVVAAHDASRTYPMPAGDVHALRGVTLDVAAGDWLALMGPSGCGKSTLLHLLGAVDLPTAGRVTLEGSDTRALDDGARTRLRLTRVGFVFQRFFLLPMLTAAENVLLPMLEARVSLPSSVTRPAVGRSTAPRRWRSVLLPQPLGPMSASQSPAATSRVTPRSAWTSPAGMG